MTTTVRKSKSQPQPALDPSKKVIKFETEHHSIIDDPRNEREFILVQDGYSEELKNALGTLSALIGPMVQFVNESAYRALATCFQHVQGRTGSTSPAEAVGGAPLLYSLDDGALNYTGDPAAFGYAYPDPATLAEVMVDLDAVPEDADIYEQVKALRTLCEAYTPEQWSLSDDAVFVKAEALRSLIVEEVVRSTADGKDSKDLATLAQRLGSSSGVLVPEGSALWSIIQRHDDGEPQGEEEQEPEGESVVDEGEPSGAEADDAASETSETPETETPTNEETNVNTGEQRAISHIRALMEQQDPTVRELRTASGSPGVKSADSSGGEGAQASSSVNPTATSSDGPEHPIIQQMRNALATPGLNPNQRKGIVDHYTELYRDALLHEVIGGENDDGTVVAGDIAAVVRSELMPLYDEIAQLKAALNSVETPRRRSLAPVPSSEDATEETRQAPAGRGYHPYRPYKPAELAQTNMPY